MPIDVLRRRQVAFPHIITEMKIPPLTVDERKHLIKSILMRYHKKLDDRPMNNQMRVLIKKSECSSPLYITVACEELRVFGVYERLSDRIKVPFWLNPTPNLNSYGKPSTFSFTISS